MVFIRLEAVRSSSTLFPAMNMIILRQYAMTINRGLQEPEGFFQKYLDLIGMHDGYMTVPEGFSLRNQNRPMSVTHDISLNSPVRKSTCEKKNNFYVRHLLLTCIAK